MEILAPFDFSQESIYAVQFGEQIARATGFKLKVLHCINLPSYPYYESDNAKSLRKLLNQDANVAVTNKLKLILGSLPDVEISEGCASSAILIKNASDDIRYTILGYKEQHFPNKIGSTVRDILRFAKGSVFSVKRAVDLQSIKSILLVTDFQKIPVESVSNVKLIQELNKAHLNVLYVNSQDNWQTTRETYGRMDEFCQVHDLQNISLDVINDNSLESGVLNKISRSKVDLIAMKINSSNEKLNLRETHLSAEKIIDNTDIPMLTFAHTSIYT